MNEEKNCQPLTDINSHWEYWIKYSAVKAHLFPCPSEREVVYLTELIWVRKV